MDLAHSAFSEERGDLVASCDEDGGSGTHLDGPRVGHGLVMCAGVRLLLHTRDRLG